MITKAGIVRIFLFGLISLLTLTFLILSTEYGSITIISSPDKKVKVYHAISTSEGGAAPYGNHIFIAPWWQPYPQFYKEPVFAGYCTGEPKLKWKNSHELIIEFKVTDIVIQKHSYKDIKIKYAITID